MKHPMLNLKCFDPNEAKVLRKEPIKEQRVRTKVYTVLVDVKMV